MRRRAVLAMLAAGTSGLAGCRTLLTDCPADPFVETNIPADRRSLQFRRGAERPADVGATDPPVIELDEPASQVRIRGVMNGSPRDWYEKNMIAVTQLTYDTQSDTLDVRLEERQCESGGAAVAESAAYELQVSFPAHLPGRVCAQEGGGFLASEDSIQRRCVSR